jgi:hypothetical protein
MFLLFSLRGGSVTIARRAGVAARRTRRGNASRVRSESALGVHLLPPTHRLAGASVASAQEPCDVEFERAFEKVVFQDRNDSSFGCNDQSAQGGLVLPPRVACSGKVPFDGRHRVSPAARDGQHVHVRRPRSHGRTS